MRIWLDDERPMPEGYDIHCKTGFNAIITIAANDYKIDFISFDHDLGDGCTGYDVAQYIERLAYRGTIGRVGWEVHSANPVGRKNITAAMNNAEKFWS